MQVGMAALTTGGEPGKSQTAVVSVSGGEPGDSRQSKKIGSLDGGDRQITFEDIAKGAAEIDKSLAAHNARLEFSVHEKTHEIMVKVVDIDTGEIIREVPPEKFLDMKAMTYEELGMLVDEKA